MERDAAAEGAAAAATAVAEAQASGRTWWRHLHQASAVSAEQLAATLARPVTGVGENEGVFPVAESSMAAADAQPAAEVELLEGDASGLSEAASWPIELRPRPARTDGGDAAAQRPQPGSYAAALLHAFDLEAVTAAHQAMHGLKAELMRHNAAAAAEILLGSATQAAATQLDAAAVSL